MARAGARGVRRFARTGEERAAELFGVRWVARRAALCAHRESDWAHGAAVAHFGESFVYERASGARVAF